MFFAAIPSTRVLPLGPDHLRGAHVPDRFRERCPDRMAQEVPEIHLHLGPMVPQRTEIDVLALGLGLVGGRAGDPRREILDREDIVVRLKDLREQGREVEPFPRRALERSVVEIEAVDLDEGAHGSPRKKQGPPKRPRALRSKPQGVLTTMYAHGHRRSSRLLQDCAVCAVRRESTQIVYRW